MTFESSVNFQYIVHLDLGVISVPTLQPCIICVSTLPLQICVLFQVIFEQVLAAVDFDVFFSVMCKRNIVIQEQVCLYMGNKFVSVF